MRHAVRAIATETVLGFDTEPVVLNAAGTAPAINQTQYCNGEHPGAGISCSLASAVNVYAKKADDSFVKVTGASLAVKSSGVYTDLKDTTLYADGSLTGSPSVASDSSDLVSIGLLGLPTNSGKKIFPAQSGSQITGQLELTDTPCGWGDAGIKLVVIPTDPEGQVASPMEVQLEQSKYFTLAKVDGAWTEQYIVKGCTFKTGYYNTQVYYREGRVLKKVAKAAKKAPAPTVVAS